MRTPQEKKLSTSDIAGADRDIAPDGREAIVPVRSEGERAGAADRRPGIPGIDDAPGPLFENADASGYRTRWSAIQTGFVDEPRKAVEEADTLVAEVMKRLAEVFAEERQRLESAWERTDQVSTEDLRLAMRRYRSFFERLLSL
jgi:hypothetical protein